MEYITSTLEIEMPRSWAINFVKDKYPSVVFAGHKFFVKKRSLRRIERELSVFEKVVETSSKDDYGTLVSAALSICVDEIIFGHLPKGITNLKVALGILGVSPVQIAIKMGVRLTEQNAVDWFKSSYVYPRDWALSLLSKKYNFPIYDNSRFNYNDEVIGTAAENIIISYLSTLDGLKFHSGCRIGGPLSLVLRSMFPILNEIKGEVE